MSGEETAVSVFSPSNLSFRQNKPIKFELLTFSPTQRKFINFVCVCVCVCVYVCVCGEWGWIGNHRSDCADSPSFFSKQLIFHTKPTDKIWNFGVLACYNQFHHFHISWIGFVYNINWLRKNWHSSFLFWKWGAVQSFSKIWTMISNSAYQKIVKFLQTGKKAKILNLIGWFCLKDKMTEQKVDTASSCPDSKELWKVSEESNSWFSIQPKKIGGIFFKQARRSKFQISMVSFV